MDKNTATSQLNQIGIGQEVRLSGKFDFNNKVTYRSGQIISIGETSVTVTDGEISYSKIDSIDPFLEVGLPPY